MAPIPCLYFVETPTPRPLTRAGWKRGGFAPDTALRRLTTGRQYVTIDNMAYRLFSEALRRAIRDSGLPYLELEQETGVHRASIRLGQTRSTPFPCLTPRPTFAAVGGN